MAVGSLVTHTGYGHRYLCYGFHVRNWLLHNRWKPDKHFAADEEKGKKLLSHSSVVRLENLFLWTAY